MLYTNDWRCPLEYSLQAIPNKPQRIRHSNLT